MVKNPPANTEDLDSVPGRGRSSAGGNVNLLQYSCWKIPWTEEPDRLQSMEPQRVNITEQLSTHKTRVS